MKRNEAEENSCLEYLYMLRKHYRKQKQDWKTRKDSNPINKYTIIPYNTLEESERTFFPVRSQTPHMPHFHSASVPSVPLCLLQSNKNRGSQSPMSQLRIDIGCSCASVAESLTASRSLAFHKPSVCSCLESLRASWQSLMSRLHYVTSCIIHTRIHFVHNLYTKTRTAANRAYNLHPH